MIILPPISDIPALQRNNNVKVVLAESNRTIFVAMDLTLPGGSPLTDKKVRQALNYAIDKEGIIKSVMFGAAAAMDAPSAPSLFGYAKQTPYAYDQAKAKQMLQEAGWKPDTTLKFIHPTGRYVQDAQAAQAIAGNLRDVGVKVELETSDWPSYLAKINVADDKGSSHMHMLGWAPGFLDAFQQMVQFTKTAWPPKGLATSHYTTDKVEEELSQASRDPSQDKRKQLYADAMKQVWDDAPWIFLWVQSFPIVHSAKVKGISSLPIEKFYAVYAEPA
jgi:peptide/nickel transport system substrate-binding protein